MKQQKPILHGRDHNCGGADPLPRYCEVLNMLAQFQQCVALVCGGDYVSVLEAPFSYSPGGTPLPRQVDTWPEIHVTGANARLKAGMLLYASFTATAFGDLDFVSTNSIEHAVSVDLPLPHTTQQTGVSASGYLIDTVWSVGDPEPDDDIYVHMIVEGSYSSTQVAASKGVLTVKWVGGLDNVATQGAPGWLYQGNYPINNTDVATGAAIAPTKLSNPGLTYQFLRADGSWQSATIQVDY